MPVVWISVIAAAAMRNGQILKMTKAATKAGFGGKNRT